MLRSINPATEERIGEWSEYTPEEVQQRIAKAQDAFRLWRVTSLEERARLFRSLAFSLRDQARTLGEIITREMGKPISNAVAEVQKCATVCDYYIDCVVTDLSSKVIMTDASESEVQYHPLGPVLAVMPWNFPFWQVMRFAVPALMAGNVGLLKHASNVSSCALAIERLFLASGFPEGVFQTLLIRAQAVEAVLRDPRVKAVTLTGSESAGRDVARIAGDAIKPSVLELGGSDPFLVFSDADLDAAALAAVTSRMQNAGQSCIAAKRFFVHGDVYDVFIKKFVSGCEALIVGDPMDEKTQLGPLATERVRMDLEGQMRASVAAGVTVCTGGIRVDRPGYFFAPTVLTNLSRTAPLCHQESFGPVACVMPFTTIDEAIEISNDTPFGLGASVWTHEKSIVDRCIRDIESGSIFVNGIVKSDPRLPFGGVKRSGYGRELSIDGLRAFVNVKTIWKC